MNETQTRDIPRISINKLGEYLVARPSRRRTILHEQRQPRTYQVIWYDLAVDAIREFIARGATEEDLLIEEIDRLTRARPESDYHRNRFATNAEAIEAFLEVYKSLELDGLKADQLHQRAPHVTFGGVGVSVRPDIILTSAEGEARVGALKLHLSKSHPLDDVSGLYIATVLHKFAEEHLGDLGEPDQKLSMVVDVFQRASWSAPRYFKRRREDIDAACEEISMMWG